MSVRHLVKRYFVAHAKAKNTTKLPPIAIQTQTGMTIPIPGSPDRSILVALWVPKVRRAIGWTDDEADDSCASRG